MYSLIKLEMYLLWIFCYFKLSGAQYIYSTPINPLKEYLLKDDDLIWAKNILNTTEDVIADSAERIGSLFIIKQDNMKFASFEIGYLVCIIQNKYKKMIDKFQSASNILSRLYKPEILIMVEEVESLYWEINHLANMLHEIERKYKLRGDLDEDYSETLKRKLDGGDGWGVHSRPMSYGYVQPKKPKKIKQNLADFIADRLTNLKQTKPRKKPGHFPIDYGWYVPPEYLSDG